jgi:hypothetical protein
MNVVVPTSKFPGSAWRQEFADALIRLRPDLNPDLADELSDSAFLTHSDLGRQQRSRPLRPWRRSASAPFQRGGPTHLNR